MAHESVDCEDDWLKIISVCCEGLYGASIDKTRRSPYKSSRPPFVTKALVMTHRTLIEPMPSCLCQNMPNMGFKTMSKPIEYASNQRGQNLIEIHWTQVELGGRALAKLHGGRSPPPSPPKKTYFLHFLTLVKKITTIPCSWPSNKKNCILLSSPLPPRHPPPSNYILVLPLGLRQCQNVSNIHWT